MTATLVLPGSAPEADWLDARRKGVTASEIAVLMGLSPYGSPFELYHRKTGTLPAQIPDNDAMALGRHMESYIAGRFQERHPEFAVGGDGRALFASLERPWQMATPDRIVYDAARISGPDLAVLECKVDGGSDEWGDDGTDEIPVHYRCQVLWQMNVMQVPAGYLACLLWQRRQVRVYELAMDDAARRDLAVMQSAARRFLERIDHGPAPEPDWRPATTGALKHLHPTVEDRDAPISTQLATWYMAADRNEKEWDRKKALYANRIRDAIGTARRAVDPGRGGQVIATRQVYDVKEHVRKACTVNKLVPAKEPTP